MIYGEITPIFKKLEQYLPRDVKLIYFDGIFEETLKAAQEFEEANTVDVFLSAGSNAQMTRSITSLPIVEMVPSGFDILLALQKAVRNKDCTGIGIITFCNPLPVLHSVSDILPTRIIERTFQDSKDMENALDSFQEAGINDVLGGFLSIVRAKDRNMRGYPIISENSIKSSLDHAIEIARARKNEIKKAKQWHAILEFAHEAIVATDDKGIITLFNRSAERIVGIQQNEALGQSASKVLINSRLEQIIKTKQTETNQIQILGDTKILTNRVPILVNNETVGTVATFQTIDDIQKAEQKIRRKLYDTGFVARTYFEDLSGRSEAFLRTKEKAIQYAKSNSTILIRGETGTGKELFAQSIHNASPRKKKPFVSINCASLSPSLLESELFGYAEGAFTGAKKGGKYGLFELAHQGTIFLDEIAEIPMEIQARLLRVLEEKQILRIGGEKIINIDIRIIAATNKNLAEMIKTGTFREDLYYRINVFSLNLPPVRERKEDIPSLFEGFFLGFRHDLSMEELHRISNHPDLINYPWPGNIRQLRNFAEQMSVIYNIGDNIDELIRELGIPAAEVIDTSQKPSGITGDEYQVILDMIKKFRGNRTKAAAALGISRTTLWRRLNTTAKL
jgi:propionate catabolism operon transcriptional regulator